MFGGGQNNNMSFGGWWKDLLIGFKYLLITTIGFGLFSIIFGGLFIKIFINYMPLTVYNFQIWRLFTSFLVDGSILQVLFCLYLLHQIIIELQKRYSTSYIILELFIQTLLCNSILYAVAIPLNLLGVIQEQYVMTFGMIHLLFIFLWKKAAQNPQSQTTFCCFPCLIPMKNLPWVYLIFFMLLGGGNIGSLIGCLVGYYQHMYLKRSLLQIRLAHYKKIQSWLPNSMKQQPSFVKISQTQTLLRTVCRQHIEPPFLNSNPFNNNRPAPQHSNPYQLQQPMNDKIQVTGKGVPIGSSSPTEAQPSNIKSYKDRWTRQTQVSQRPQNLKNNIQDQIRSQNSFNQKDQPDMNESMMSEKPLNMQDQQDLSDNSDKNLKKNGFI